jgi:c-di-GMP-binding flagellar brake protein YcgR
VQSDEKREQKRFYFTLDVEFDISTHQQWVESSAKNISTAGMCLLSKEYLPTNSLLFIKFKVPDSDTLIEVTGEVVWHGDHLLSGETYYENGIKFIEIKSMYKELIGKYIDGVTFQRKNNLGS